MHGKPHPTFIAVCCHLANRITKKISITSESITTIAAVCVIVLFSRNLSNKHTRATKKLLHWLLLWGKQTNKHKVRVCGQASLLTKLSVNGTICMQHVVVVSSG